MLFEINEFSDCYLFSRITHYEQRLRTLYYLKRFPERMGDVKPKVTGIVIPAATSRFNSDALLCGSFEILIFLSLLAVAKASRQVFHSRKFRDLLEVVLAFGNYMNRGARGNAAGT